MVSEHLMNPLRSSPYPLIHEKMNGSLGHQSLSLDPWQPLQGMNSDKSVRTFHIRVKGWFWPKAIVWSVLVCLERLVLLSLTDPYITSLVKHQRLNFNHGTLIELRNPVSELQTPLGDRGSPRMFLIQLFSFNSCPGQIANDLPDGPELSIAIR